MKVCPNCQTKYPDDANFCPQETCATANGPRRLEPAPAAGSPRYEPADRLGGSRSGEVYRAKDTQTGALVAYKKIARSASGPAVVQERTLRELKQLQRAQSHRLPAIIDFGKDAAGELFVVSELVEGRPLDRLVAETGPLPLDRAKGMVAEIGEALIEGQKVGVVHHDLAAKNVLVAAGDSVKLINFVAPVPATDTVFGVPEYLSPEQAEGKLVDQRSNTYSLGAILLFMLTGQPPVPAGDPGATIQAILKGEIVPPSRRIPGLNAEIDRVIGKAMDRNPNRRPLSMKQFLSEVAMLSAPAAQSAERPPNVAFAKTMMFTGGLPQLQSLMSQANAGHAEANSARVSDHGSSTRPIGTIAGSSDHQPTPAPAARAGEPAMAQEPEGPKRTHGPAIAATMIAIPTTAAAAPGIGGGPSAPPDVDAVPIIPPTVATNVPTPGQPTSATAKPGGAFRETLWFKQGDVDQMVADARAKIEAARGKGAPAVVEPEVPLPDVKPLEDRYRDDGSVTVDDRKKYSLRSGATATALPAVGAVPGERMSAEEMIGEIGNGKRVAIIAVAVLVMAAIVGILVYVVRGNKHTAEHAAEMTPHAVETPQPVSAPAQPAAAPAPTAAPPSPPTELAAAIQPATKPDNHPSAARKHAAKRPRSKKQRR
jgi:eukaryotic-like serine/threonine-protein kinase